MKYVTGAPRTFQIGVGGHALGYLVHPREIISSSKIVMDLLVEMDRFGADTEIPSERKRFKHPKKYAHFEN